MQITHKTLAVASGIVLLGIVLMNMHAAENSSSPEREAEKTSEEEKVKDRVLMNNQGITKVPETVFTIDNTKVLDLSHNNLEGALPAEVRHLQHLKELNLSHNKFTGVPAEVGQLTELEVLNLSYNKLTGLPYELGNLKNLKVLDLRGNPDYSRQDLEIIREGLPDTVEILTD